MAFVRQAGEKPRGGGFGGCIMPRVGLIRRLLTTQLLLRTRSIKCEKKEILSHFNVFSSHITLYLYAQHATDFRTSTTSHPSLYVTR